MRVSRGKSGASPNKPEEALNLCAVLFKLSVRVYTAGSLLSSLFNACICECGRQNTRQSKEQKTAAETFISWCILYYSRLVYFTCTCWLLQGFGGGGCKVSDF